MCATCGCGSKTDQTILNLQTGAERSLADSSPAPTNAHSHAHSHAHSQAHAHAHDHHHDHRHDHGHDHGHAHQHTHPHEPGHDHHHDDRPLRHHASYHDHGHGHAPSVVELETRILEKNDRLAARNRGWFEGREILALNLVSSPGAGKTTLLERTIRELKDQAIFVIEGDQATANDGQRIRAAGAAAVQVNTGTGCHLEADMVAKGLEELRPPFRSMVLIENVGNLVCPALFDLGERAKVIVFSVTEGEDKPLKYPHMFRAADLMIVNKADLLPHVDFNVDGAIANARAVNPDIVTITLSARTGEGMDKWYGWLRSLSKADTSPADRLSR